MTMPDENEAIEPRTKAHRSVRFKASIDPENRPPTGDETSDSDSDDDNDAGSKKSRNLLDHFKKAISTLKDALREECEQDHKAAASKQNEHDQKTAREMNTLFLRAALKMDDEELAYLLQKTKKDSKTLLHTIMQEDSDSLASLEPLLQYMIDSNPDRILEQDDTKKTALHTAIDRTKPKHVEWICNAIGRLGSVFADSLLLKQDSEGNNCIHTAVKKSHKSERRQKMALKVIGLANGVVHGPESSCALCATNNEGHTPLHLAVEYSRCTDLQSTVVRKLIDRCDRSLDASLILAGTNAPLSVYRHHCKTRSDAEEKEKGRIKNKQHTRGENSSSVVKAGTPSTKASAGQERTSRPQMRRASAADLDMQSARDPATQDVEDRNAGIGEVGTGVDKERSRKEASSDGKKQKPEPTTRIADEINLVLKLHFMRTRKDHKETIEFLYGGKDCQAKNIHFSLPKNTPKVRQDSLEALMRGLEFEDTLQYVELPAITIEKSKTSRPVRGVARQNQGIQRSATKDDSSHGDLSIVFTELRKKGVRRIFNLHVEDRDAPSHSDEAIETALQGIDVLRKWDWRRHDISPDIILSVAPKVSELCLYWTGNNAILRSWSEPEGLQKLTNLKSVVLHEKQGLESSDRVASYLRMFEDRLNSYRGSPKTIRNNTNVKQKALQDSDKSASNKQPPLKKVEDDSISKIHVKYVRAEPQVNIEEDSKASEITHENLSNRHKWLETMDTFGDFIQNIYLDDSSRDVDPPIQVALIDDGLDMLDRELVGRVKGGMTFCARGDQTNEPYWITSGGHGTIMGKLICRVCPKATLFVLKLDEHPGANNNRQITAKSAAQAVYAAIGKKVDIISMSWTLEATGQNDRDIDDLQEALMIAAKQKILLFCAADDQGPQNNNTYPNLLGKGLKIGAATSTGTVWKWTGNTRVDFIFPGDEVHTHRQSEFGSRSIHRSESGSSVATALSAGLAALVLYCVQFSMHRATEKKPYDYLRSWNGMSNAFKAIGLTKETYVEVWNCFDVSKPKYDSMGPEQKREKVDQIAQRLLKKLRDD